jgi:prepilin-type N-terminal cleavage/methylation domain-containing protein
MHNGERQSKGFTLLEIVIVIALTTLVATLALGVSFDDYRGYAHRDEWKLIRAALEKARAESLASVCGAEECERSVARGVYFGTPGTYVLFVGDAYETRMTSLDEVIDARDEATQVSGMRSVIFAPASAAATAEPRNTLVVTSANTVTTLSVDPVGRISTE